MGECVSMTNDDHSGDFLKLVANANAMSRSCEDLPSLSSFFAPSANSDNWNYLHHINSMDGQSHLHPITNFGLEQITGVDNNFNTIPFPSAPHSFYDEGHEAALR